MMTEEEEEENHNPLMERPSLKEFEQPIKALKSYKASGFDKFPSELYKIGSLSTKTQIGEQLKYR